MNNPIGLKAGETVLSRFGNHEPFTVIECNGCVVVVRDAAGETFPIAIGDVRRAEGLAA